jgi:hypothetical protein
MKAFVSILAWILAACTADRGQQICHENPPYDSKHYADWRADWEAANCSQYLDDLRNADAQNSPMR